MAATSRKRREEIARITSLKGPARVGELASRFGVTASTIRRDLAQLTNDGLLARTYGGAIAASSPPEASLRQRAGDAFEAKRGIARWAATRVAPGDAILLDSGSTVAAFAHELRETMGLTVATTSLPVVEELGDLESVEVACLGGSWRRLSRGFVGPLTESALERMRFDRAFLGADAVTVDDGICEADLRQTRLKEVMASRADDVYVLAHAAKIGIRPFHAWAKLAPGWTLVTDDSVEPGTVTDFARNGVSVIAVDDEGRPVGPRG